MEYSLEEYLEVLKTITVSGSFEGKVVNNPKESDLPSNKIIDNSSTAHTILDDLIQEVSLEILLARIGKNIQLKVEENTPRVKLFSEDEKVTLFFHLDPLDGTWAYLNGSPDYTVGAAISIGTNFLVSAIYFPTYDKLYSAIKSKGVRVETGLKSSIEFKRKSKPASLFCEKRCKEFIPIVHQMGLSHYDLSKSAHNTMISVAEGKLAMQMYHLASSHDFGIPQVILEEAGGVCTDLNGETVTYQADFKRIPYFFAFYDNSIAEEFFNTYNQKFSSL
jgi:myo-inositol-1(or 4)-monophosphatase